MVRSSNEPQPPSARTPQGEAAILQQAMLSFMRILADFTISKTKTWYLKALSVFF
jgi:hypothetical protein